ncbi:MAG: hypothetical protein HC869_24920 [Rhodospirillales bacterium]|nr:hypothetical protein [Rhodospirillales bacterium]
MEPVTKGVKVEATGLKKRPVVNSSGFFVWLEEDGLQPQEVIVDGSATQYESIAVPAPVLPARSKRIELAPNTPIRSRPA